MSRSLALMLLWAGYSAAPLHSQIPPRAQDLLKRIFASKDFQSGRFGPAQWLEEGAAYTTIEASAEVSGAQDIVRYETATGARKVHIPPGS